MGFTRTWRCAFCGKQTTLKIARHEVSEAVYEAEIPKGWIWQKYNSIRFPDRDSRVLGCCPEHAQKAINTLLLAMP